jgi:8-oxo-dGTP diphosphatase
MADKTRPHLPYCYQYPHPAVTVDCVVFGLGDDDLKVLLIERKHAPCARCWAIPGGFVNLDETLDAAARRELREETGVENVYLEQFHTFGEPGRDPRERVISVAFYVLVKPEDYSLCASSDARDVRWFSLKRLPRLAFDHQEILARAAQCLRDKLGREPVGFELLPEKFKLPQLQRLYELILERPLDKRNFRRRMLASGVLLALREWDRSAQRRPARLYRFDRRKCLALKQKGFHFIA